MKKLLWIFAAATLLVTACNNNPQPGGDNDAPDVPSQTGFDITVSQITASCANIDVAADSTNTYFYFDVIESEIITAYDSVSDIAEAWVADIFEMIDEYAEYYGEYYEFADFLSRSEDSYFYACMLSPKTKYTVIAFEVDQQGNIGSKIATKEFTTTEVKKSNNTFQISIIDGVATIDASNKAEYYLFEIYEKSELEGLTESQIISQLIYDAIDYGISDFIMGCGMDELDYSEYLVANTEYSAVCVGYDGGATTALTRYDFTYTSTSGDSDYDSDLYEGMSNLSQNANFTPEYIYVMNCGDYYYSSTTNIMISNDEAEDIGFQAEIFIPLNSSDFMGTFHVSNQIGTVNSLMRGYEDYEYTMYGTWYMDWNNEEYSAAVDGKIVLSGNNSNLNLSLEFTDENSKKVTISYNGEYTYEDYSAEYASVATTTPSALKVLKSRPMMRKKSDKAKVANAPSLRKKPARAKKLHKKVSLAA